jgi:hypothetical protein
VERPQLCLRHKGNDLNVKVLDRVTFTVSQDMSESRYGFYFWDLIDKGTGSAGFNLVFDEATVLRLIERADLLQPGQCIVSLILALVSAR